jgi:formylglycine-generating enzyme required for sulfatase activity
MVHAFDAALEVSFCIDRHEVTQAAYVAFLADVGDASGVEQPPACAFNTSLTHTPDASCPSFTEANQLPVWCVDWCDAHAYCDWASKRLCGKIGGGSLSPLEASITQDEWYFACSRGYQRKYPYASEPMAGACNIPEENTPTTDDNSDKAIVESFPECEGGFDGLFDMQGNVAEWTDWCEDAGDGTGTEACWVRGGHTFGTAEYWSCDALKEEEPRNLADRREVGFRCCKDAGP